MGNSVLKTSLSALALFGVSTVSAQAADFPATATLVDRERGTVTTRIGQRFERVVNCKNAGGRDPVEYRLYNKNGKLLSKTTGKETLVDVLTTCRENSVGVAGTNPAPGLNQ